MTTTYQAPRRLSAAVTLAVAIAATLDSISTYVGLHGGAVEQNGVAAELFSTVGLVPVLLARVVIPVGLAFVALHFTNRLRGRDRLIHTLTCSAFLFVATGWLGIAASNTFGWL